MPKKKWKSPPHPSALPVPSAIVARAPAISVIVKVVVASRAQMARNNAHHVLNKPSPRSQNGLPMPHRLRKPKAMSVPSAIAAGVDVIAASALSVPSVNHSKNR